MIKMLLMIDLIILQWILMIKMLLMIDFDDFTVDFDEFTTYF